MSTPLGQLPQLAFNVVETARLLGFIADEDVNNPVAIRRGAWSVRKLIRDGLLKPCHSGKAYRIARTEIERFLEGAGDPIQHPDSAAS